MTREEIVQELGLLVSRWRDNALAAIPPEYSERGLVWKYLKMDNEAAGFITCADELSELLEKLENPLWQEQGP